MKVTHKLTVKAKCPVNDATDTYLLKVTVARLLPVEEILEAVAKLTAAPLFQEELTERLAKALNATVTTTGVHSGVETEVEVL